MDPEIIDFLKTEHVSALTTLLPGNIPHTSSMHFAFDPETQEFVFFTKKVSRKCIGLLSYKNSQASLSVGFDENKMMEFQAEGNIKMIKRDMSGDYEKVFADKFKGAELDSEHIVLVFVPTWWRYTEFKPKFKVISSEK